MTRPLLDYVSKSYLGTVWGDPPLGTVSPATIIPMGAGTFTNTGLYLCFLGSELLPLGTHTIGQRFGNFIVKLKNTSTDTTGNIDMLTTWTTPVWNMSQPFASYSMACLRLTPASVTGVDIVSERTYAVKNIRFFALRLTEAGSYGQYLPFYLGQKVEDWVDFPNTGSGALGGTVAGQYYNGAASSGYPGYSVGDTLAAFATVNVRTSGGNLMSPVMFRLEQYWGSSIYSYTDWISAPRLHVPPDDSGNSTSDQRPYLMMLPFTVVPSDKIGIRVRWKYPAANGWTATYTDTDSLIYRTQISVLNLSKFYSFSAQTFSTAQTWPKTPPTFMSWPVDTSISAAAAPVFSIMGSTHTLGAVSPLYRPFAEQRQTTNFKFYDKTDGTKIAQPTSDEICTTEWHTHTAFTPANGWSMPGIIPARIGYDELLAGAALPAYHFAIIPQGSTYICASDLTATSYNVPPVPPATSPPYLSDPPQVRDTTLSSQTVISFTLSDNEAYYQGSGNPYVPSFFGESLGTLAELKSIWHTTDSLTFAEESISHTTNTRLLPVYSYTQFHTTNALMLAETAISHDTNTLAYAEESIAHTSNMLAFAEESVIHTTNTWLYDMLDHTTNLLLKRTYGVSHDTNTLVAIEYSKYHTTNTAFLDEISITHTSNALLLAEKQITHATNALLFVERSIDHTTNVWILGDVWHTTNAALKKVDIPLTHTTNSLVAKEVSITHTTNSNVMEQHTVLHTTNLLTWWETSGEGTLDFGEFAIDGVADEYHYNWVTNPNIGATNVAQLGSWLPPTALDPTCGSGAPRTTIHRSKSNDCSCDGGTE